MLDEVERPHGARYHLLEEGEMRRSDNLLEADMAMFVS